MSSHHDWIEEVTAQHDTERPFAPENGQALKFGVGDMVVYKNQAGVEFRRCVTGFFRSESPSAQYARGARYLINSTSPWMPVSEASLRLVG